MARRGAHALYEGWESHRPNAALAKRVKDDGDAMKELEVFADISKFRNLHKYNRATMNRYLVVMGAPRASDQCDVSSARDYLIFMLQMLQIGKFLAHECSLPMVIV